MRSPFSGMDPFIEGQGKWEDFHNKLLGDIERLLSRMLPTRYTVRLGERSYIDYLSPRCEGEGERTFKPDVGIKTSPSEPRETIRQTSVLDDTALDMEGLVEVEFREMFVEIHEMDPQLRLVTGIEVLSPSNKRRGTVGWYQYGRKRAVFMRGHANLVEIDLLRSGRRHGMVEPWPHSPYYLLVLRKNDAPHCKVNRAHYRSPLPVLNIPLAPPDSDVPLPLQPLVDDIYDRSRYAREIDYTRPLRPPLPADDIAWLQTQMTERPV